MATVRQSNIELCRIISIIFVLLVHSTFYSLGDDVSYVLMLMAAAGMVGLNAFILITGYFSVTPKPTSIIHLAFICLFWAILKFGVNLYYDQEVTIDNLFFISDSNWFVPSYLILVCFAPILNTYSKSVSQKTLFWMCVLLLSLEVWFDWVPPFVHIGYIGGYSALHFLTIYLIARYIRLYGLPLWFRKWSLFIYIFSTFLVATAYYAKKNGLYMPFNIYELSNPITNISSFAFFSLFEQWNIGNSKVINHVAKSTLSILLGHVAIGFLYRSQFSYIYNQYDGLQLVVYWIIAIVTLLISIVIFDQLRIMLYKPIGANLKRVIKNNELFVS